VGGSVNSFSETADHNRTVTNEPRRQAAGVVETSRRGFS
jgi:hypothetical protein